jgi:hypothetical protein
MPLAAGMTFQGRVSFKSPVAATRYDERYLVPGNPVSREPRRGHTGTLFYQKDIWSSLIAHGLQSFIPFV